jgi:hypothetical protein
MRPLRKTLLPAIVAGVSLVGFAVLSGAASTPVPTQPLFVHRGEPMPAPVMGDDLFAPIPAGYQSASVGGRCVPADDVLTILALDVEKVGGRIFMMTDGIQQEFSDSWRLAAGGERVDVSLVLAHLFPNSGGEPIVDVVEFDAQGCAFSRTLLSSSDWLDVIELAEGVEV